MLKSRCSVIIACAALVACKPGIVTQPDSTKPAVVAAVSVAPAARTIAISEQLQLVPTVTDAAGKPLTGRPIAWSSSDPSIATVSGSGLVIGVKAGVASVTATVEGKKGTANITVAADAPPPPPPPPPPPSGGTFYVAPNGSASGNGSISAPWNLATALAQPSAVEAGDTIWLRGGTYRGNYVSKLTGTASAPIVVRQYPGERAVLNGNGGGRVLRVDGAYTWFWGFEIVDSLRNSTSGETGGIDVFGNGTHIINLVIHDVSGNGIGLWRTTAGGEEVYGTIIYNNGWQGTDRGHGHAIYTQNEVGTKHVIDNVFFNQFGFGLHAYGSAIVTLDNYEVVGNVSFNSGSISAASDYGNMVLGGIAPVRHVVVKNNMFYRSPGLGGTSVALGLTYGSTANTDLQMRDNYIAGDDRMMELIGWSNVVMTGNEFYGTTMLVDLIGSTSGYQWSGNTHYADPARSRWAFQNQSMSWSDWRAATGLGSSDNVQQPPPPSPRVFVRPNKYEPKRANIIVYNWSKAASVSADLTGVLASGDKYEVRSVQRLFGAPVASGTYGGGSISIPMGTITPPAVIGGSASPPPVTGPEFDVFILTRVP